MENTKERQLAAMLYQVANADGKIVKEEFDSICRMATSFKDFDGVLLKRAFDDELKNPSDLRNLVEHVKADDKAKLIYACADIIFADGIISFEEVCRLHEIADMMDIPAPIVSYYTLKVMYDYPGVRFDDKENGSGQL